MPEAAVRYWRASGRISVKEDHGAKALYYEERLMLNSSQVNKVVVEEFESKKGSGAGKLACPLRDKSNRHRNAKFQNKAKLKSVRARDVHVKHRIYFMDMNRKGSAKMNGHLYQYSLTVIDVFSR